MYMFHVNIMRMHLCLTRSLHVSVCMSMPMCVYLLILTLLQPKPQGCAPLGHVCVCVRYLRGLVGSPAVLVAVEAGQQHVLICVHLAKAQCLVGIVTDHIVAVD